MAPVEESIDAVKGILEPWRSKLDDDYQAYRNHVHRVLNFCFALRDCNEEDRQKLIVAACFHDLGIWSAGTFDYLTPSIDLAREHLERGGLGGWVAEVELMIGMHHKLRPFRDESQPLVEVFRLGDLVDFSRGLLKCGVSPAYYREVTRGLPNAGFHRKVVKLELGWFWRHPLRPIPVARW